MLDDVVSELRLACRRLLRSREFAASAVLALGVGITGTTVMFTLVRGVLLRPLPVLEQNRLLVAWNTVGSEQSTHWPFFRSDVQTIQESSRLLERVAGVSYNGAQKVVVFEGDNPIELAAAAVTGEFFDVLGVKALLGRALRREDDVKGAEPVLVLTHRLWMRQYGGARDVIGRRVTRNDRPFTIVGVMPADVEYPLGVEAWTSVAADTALLTDSNFRIDVDLIARTRPGVTLGAATSELASMAPHLEANTPPNAGRPRGLKPVVRTFEEAIVGDVRRPMLVLFTAVGLLLITACANVANLLLLRAAVSRSDLAVRAALGASRQRLIRHLLVETLVLAVLAALVAVALTWWTLPTVIALAPDGLPRIDAIRVDVTVMAFAIVVAIAAVAGASLGPSSVAAHLVSDLGAGTRVRSGRRERQRRRVLVLTQVTLAVTILAASGLLATSLLRLRSADLGMTTEPLSFVSLSLPVGKYTAPPARRQLLDSLVREFEGAPGVAAATPIHVLPFSGTGGWDAPTFTVEGQPAERVQDNPSLNVESVDWNYFRTFAIPMVKGRPFATTDTADTPKAAIISADLAARIWPGQNPVGQRLKIGGVTSPDPWRTIVGVAAPTRYRELAVRRPTLYLPAAQFVSAAEILAVRAASPGIALGGLARDAVRAIDPSMRVLAVTPFSTLLGRPLARPRFIAAVISLFAAAALLLAAIGVYAVIAESVRQRTAEIGVRIALGAAPGNIQGLVLREGLWLVGAGAMLGLATSLVVTHWLGGLLFQIDPGNPQILLGAALIVAAVAGVACYVPASRAARTDPAAILKGSV